MSASIVIRFKNARFIFKNLVLLVLSNIQEIQNVGQKNPTAVQIGQRIKQARKMAGFDTAAQLLENIDDWGTGRLGNYEAGISIPSPDDIKTIANITDSSPCWIMFGHGPIRSAGRDIQAIRHQNFVYIFESCKTQKGAITKLLKSIGLSRKKVDEYLNNPFLTIPDRIARKCEKFAKRKIGWIDAQHVETDPICASFPEDMQRLMMIFSELSELEQKRLVKLAEIFTDDS